MNRPGTITAPGLAFLAVVIASLSGCAGSALVERRTPEELAWPSREPRIRLQSVIDLQQSQGRAARRALNWLASKQTQSLFRRPYAVAWAGDDILVTDPDAGRVARISEKNRLTFSERGLFMNPIGIASCGPGIVVSDSATGKIALLDDDLRLTRWLAEDLARPTGVACSDGRIYVAETARHRLLVMEQDGDTVQLGKRGKGAGEFNFPTTIAIDGNELLVGDAMNFRIQRLDATTGRYIGEFGGLGDAPGEMPRIKGVAVDTIGHVWVSDGHLDRVSLYDRDGTLLLSIGDRGSEHGRFSFPAGVASHPDGRVAVSDSLNRRLQIMRLTEGSRADGN